MEITAEFRSWNSSNKGLSSSTFFFSIVCPIVQYILIWFLAQFFAQIFVQKFARILFLLKVRRINIVHSNAKNLKICRYSPAELSKPVFYSNLTWTFIAGLFTVSFHKSTCAGAVTIWCPFRTTFQILIFAMCKSW